MRLYIPEQYDPENNALPSHPRKVKKWLATLPQANMGEMTRQIYSRIHGLNREKMSNKHRLENMETFREPVRNVFDHLKKYFVNRTLPLPEKSKKIVTLNQSLLQEMALGYKIIVYEAANKIDDKIDDKSIGIAISRAIKYQSELLFRASEIYGQIPEGNWYDIYQMYPYAELKKIHDKPFKDLEHPNSKSTIENAYKHVLLFSLARPTAMRQSDSERVFNKLYKWSELATLGGQADESQINNLFCSRVGDDHPPSYLNQYDCETTGKVYTLDTTKLVNSIKKQIQEKQKNPGAITVGDDLSLETLNALTVSWGACPERRFSRAERDGHIAVAIGLTYAAKRIREGNILETNKPSNDKDYIPPIDHKENFSLESIPDELKSMQNESSGYITHTEIGNTKENAWDMVAKGKVMTEAFNAQCKITEKNKVKLNKEDDDLHWEVVNISAGGYCLRWNSENTSKAQIGELIAIQEREPNGHYEWRIGTIRWMQFTRENGLEIGVQVMSPKVIAAKVQRYNRPKEKPFDCLVLPQIKPLNQPMTIVLPAHAFKTKDRLNIIIPDDKMDIELGERGEHTGSFTQFQLKSTESRSITKKQKKNDDNNSKKDDFDGIWSSL